MHNRRYTTFALSVIATGSLLLTGCSDGRELAAEEDGTIDRIGLMVQDLSNPFFIAMQEGVESAAEEMDATVTTEDGRQDLGAQNEQIDAFIQQGIDILLINAVDSEGIGSAVQRATEAGITVVAVDVTAKGAQAFVTSDNVQAGTQACTHLAEQIGGEGEILLVDGTPISSVQDRVTGCEEVLAEEYPDVEIVAKQSGDNGRNQALTITTDMLTANPDVKGIFGINDPTALGATLAAEQAGYDDLVITGVDGSPQAEEELQKEDSMFVGTAAQDPKLLGVTGLEMAEKLYNGEELENSERLVETKLITRDNLDEYEGWQ
ncbi:ABC transporter substrate-binding protein [Salinactinospora qingdaonensis]|uniref:ABC transporter substrate-binding protein n=1 Tax=Salinactinospora qingdaonensis TaxID=702744 RepID=A0ABP7F656_9ACTN